MLFGHACHGDLHTGTHQVVCRSVCLRSDSGPYSNVCINIKKMCIAIMSCLCEVTKRRHMWSPDMQGHSSPRPHSHRLTPCKKKCSDDLAQQLMLRIGCMSLERINLLRAVTTSVSLQAGSDADIHAKPKKRHNSARETRACIPWHSLSRRP